MEYLDFELEIDSGNGSDYPVAVIRSPVGEAHATMHFPFDKSTLDSHLSALQNALLNSGDLHAPALSTNEQTMQKFGESLFNALFIGEVRDSYMRSRGIAINQNKGLRLKLAIQSAALAALPWEFLYDPQQAQYLCLSDDTSVVRYLELSEPSQPLSITPPLYILGMAPSPKNLPNLDVDGEKQRIETALADLQAQGRVKLTWLSGQTWEDLQQAMSTGTWHIFHFIGHGEFDSDTNEGIIALEDNARGAYYLHATDLALLLADHPHLRLVVLNSCKGARGSTLDIFSSTAATLVRRGIPAVLANQYDITDEAAIELSRTFYGVLCQGNPVDMAISEARKAMKVGIPNTLQWGTPVLSIHVPDGVVFDMSAEKLPLSPNAPVISQLPFFQSDLSRRVALGAIGIVAVGGVAALGWFWHSSHADQPSATPTPTPTPTSIAVGTTFLIYNQQQVVRVVGWSPNGKYIASTGDNGTIQVWDANSGKLATTNGGHAPKGVSALAWSNDSRFIASAGSDKTVQIWEVATNTTIYTYPGHSQAVNTVAWSPNDTRIASGGDDKQVHVWDSFSGSNVVTYKGHTALIHGVSWSPDGLSIVSASNDKTLQVWNALTAEKSLTYSGHTDLVYGVAWSPGGIHIASVGADGTVQVWDPITGAPLFVLRGHTSYTIDVAWSPDSSQIASSSFDNTVRIWDVTTGKELYVYRGHTSYVFGVSWSPDGKRIASAGTYDRTVRVWKAH
jgi:hypothetical protein